MSINAARRVIAQPVRRPEATILTLPVVRSVPAAANAGSRPERPTGGAAKPRGTFVVPALLATLLVLACLAWEALSGGF